MKRNIPLPSSSFFLRSVLVVVYAPAEVIIFLNADIPRNRLGASLGFWLKQVKLPTTVATSANSPRFQIFANGNENLSNVCQTLCLLEQRVSSPFKHAKPTVFGIWEPIKHKFLVYQVYRFANWYSQTHPNSFVRDWSLILAGVWVEDICK